MRDPKLANLPRFPYFLFFLSHRYLRSRFSALAALLSVAFGVAIILIVLSIMGGYVEELKESIRGQEAHLMVVGRGAAPLTRITRLEELVGGVENVEASAPFVETLAMYRSGQFNPCQLRGILPRRQAKVSRLGSYVLRPPELASLLKEMGIDHSGPPDEAEKNGRAMATRTIDNVLRAPSRRPLDPEELEDFFRRDFARRVLEERNPGIVPDLQGKIPPSCLVGIQLLLERHVFLGQVVTIITLDPKSSEPTAAKFVVVGAFKTGDYDADAKALYAHVDTLKNMLNLFDPLTNSYGYQGLRVAVKDLSRLQETRVALETELLVAAAKGEAGGPEEAYRDLRVLTWEQLRSNLLKAVKIEKFVIYFLLVLLMSFTACMVLLMLMLMVIEKTRDMGVLMSLGSTPGSLQWVFLVNGMILSASGTLLGLALGYLFCAYINPIHDWLLSVTGVRLFPAEIYHMDRIPISFRPSDVLLSIAPPVLLGLLASLIPARWASRRDPIKAIHYE